MNIIITGASKGLGFAVAERFAAANKQHTFFICARSAKELDNVTDFLQQTYPQNTVRSFVCDVSKKEQIILFSQWVLAQTTWVDILVNNAGRYLPGNVSDEPEGTLETMIEVNLYSAYHLTRALLPAMITNRRGHIFNMCSVASLKAYPGGGAYSISKFALMGFSKNLREELKEHNIKVTAVYPGAAMSDSWRGSGISPQRIMEANDVADVIYAAAHLSAQACVEDIILRPQLGDL